MTMNKRDLLLQEMGISQWQLRYPERLKGSIKIIVPEGIHLLVVSEETINTQSSLFKDILRSLNLSDHQWQSLTLNQLQHLQLKQTALFWLLTDQQERDSLYLKQYNAQHIWLTPSWSAFQSSAQAKRQLWQQIQSTPH